MTSMADGWIAHWRAGMRWRRQVELELGRLRLTFSQWLVLDCVATLLRETQDAVSQLQVGHRLELDKATISALMKRLDERGLIDRSPAFPGPEYRIYLQAEGRRLAARGRALVDAVSARLCAEPRYHEFSSAVARD